jgi:hypothetical protein
MVGDFDMSRTRGLFNKTLVTACMRAAVLLVSGRVPPQVLHVVEAFVAADLRALELRYVGV